ncbi:MAG: adenylate kinase [Bacteroidota bacterium]
MLSSGNILSGVKRINIVGTTGSGKSAFSKKLSRISGIPYVQIDQIYWGADWYEPTDEEFFPKLREALNREQWILDGNYGRTVPIKWKDVQVVIWLDYPFPLVFYRAVKRAITRAISKEELWPGTGNKESFRRSFLSRDSILGWTIKTYSGNRTRYLAAMRDTRFSHIQFVRLKSSEEALVFLEELEKANA